MKKLLEILPWTEFLDVHLIKDTTVFAYYFHKQYGVPVEIVFCDNKKTGTKLNDYNGIKLIKLLNTYNFVTPPRFRQIVKFHKFINIFKKFLRSKKGTYSHVMFFHITPYTMILSRFVKKINPSVQIYVKADSGCIKGLSFLLFKHLLTYVDLFSIEKNKEAERLQKSFPGFSHKIFYVPNGFDNEIITTNNIKINSYDDKQNCLITAARLGSYQKNTEFLLRFLDNLKFNGWKVKLIGEYTQEVFKQYKEICAHNKEFADAVELTGNISNREELFTYYNNAKIFVLPSRWESFGLAALEAMSFGCFPVISPIDSADTLTANGTFGKVLPLDQNLWSSEIQGLIDDEEIMNRSYQTIIDYCSQKLSMNEISKSICFKKFFSSEKVYETANKRGEVL